MISVTFDRSFLGLADLTIGTDPSANLWIDEEGAGRPVFAFRKTHAPDSSTAAGKVLLTAVRDLGGLPLTVYARGDAAADEFEDALAQPVYPLTLTVDGTSRTFTAECEAPEPGLLDSGMVGAGLHKFTVVVPVNPPGA